MATVPALAETTGPVPQYSGAAEVTGSLIFIALVAVIAVAVLRRRRR
ncbi:hypothetical protein KDL01_20470 [Actinospica durhamensis]|uniref:LPXTG cell wall anchor domain-containing protein n=1 Tax=Actinospica durhamensis TaxID=1508375 RepID=A0A941IRT7_9ACTN|nr:MYXO-CTERM sorting domain-containing protein [Actinospica durhamensis]MBR7835662.1 hypothetical protein [Actinospica durhamensis]